MDAGAQLICQVGDALFAPVQSEEVIGWDVHSDGWWSVAANQAANVFGRQQDQLILHVSLRTDVPASVQRNPTSGARPGLVTSAGC